MQACILCYTGIGLKELAQGDYSASEETEHDIFTNKQAEQVVLPV